MIPFRHLLLVSAFVFASVPYTFATNPAGSTSSCGGCESSGSSSSDSSSSDSSSSSSPNIQSLEWAIKVGLARYAKPSALTDFGQAAYEKDGNLPDFKEMFGRYFSSSPLQQRQIRLEISQPQISNATFHPSCLFLQSEAIFETLKKPATDGFPEYIHQILTDDAFTLIDLLPAPESGWRLRVWKRNAAALTKSGDYYVTTGFVSQVPLKDVTFKRPTGTTGNNTLVYVQKETTGVSGTRTITNEIVQTLDGNGKPATVTTKIFSGEGTGGPLLSQENLIYSDRGAKAWDYTITREILTASVDAAGTCGTLTLTAKTQENYDDFSTTSAGGELGMKRLVSRTEAYNVSGQSPQTTTNTYIQAPNNLTVHGRLQSTVKPDGSWTYSEYSISPSSPVSITTEYTGWKDLTLAQRTSARKTVTTVSANGSVVEKFVAGQLVEKSQTILTLGISETLTANEQWDGSAWHVTTTAYYADNATAPSTGRIKWIEKSDGTAATYTYVTVSGNLVMTARTGAGNRSGITAGTEVKTTYGVGNIPIAQITKDISSNLVTEQWDTDPTYNSGFDAMGRPIKRIYNADVDDYDISQYACCGLEFSRDRMGGTTSYSRDGLKRVYKVETKASAASPAVTTFTTVDGLTTTQTRRFGGSDSLFLGSATRSLDGLTTTNIGPSRKSNLVADRPVTTKIISHSNAGDTTTTTYADGSTSITANYLDGRIKSISGTAVSDMSYDYATHSENGGGEKTITTASGLVTSTFMDLLSRTIKSVSTAYGTTSYYYHPLSAAVGFRGKLKSVTDGDNVTVSYGYNAEGERNTVSRTIPLVGGSTVQVITTNHDVVSNAIIKGTNLGISKRQTQTIAATGVSPIVTSQSYVAINGLVSGSSSLGSQTLTVKTRANATTAIATESTTNPDGTQAVKTIIHGLLTSALNKSTTGSVITGTTYTYDAFQWQNSIADLRTGATNYSNFTEAGQPLTTTTNGNANVTSVEYDIMGRPIKTTLPDTSVKHIVYYSTGRVKVTWGSQTYPSWNVYDEQGRQTELHTWKASPILDPASMPSNPPSGSEVTSWVYGASTGHLNRKQYADGKGTDYTYTTAGRLATRVWARGVTTTYGYINGLMTSTNYSDSTPDVMITYEPFGRQSSVTQTNQSQLIYTYNAVSLALDTETIKYDLDHDGSYEFTRVLDRSRDSLNRDSGWQLKDGTTIESYAIYGYSATDGRLKTVVGGGGPSSPQTFTYDYVSNSNLLETVTGPIHTVINTWEANRDVLDIKENKVGSNVISRFDYTVNSLGQRTGVVTSGAVFPASPSCQWGYDSLGQVVSADSSVNTNDRTYLYDAIGNRKKFADGLTLLIDDNYTSNLLNQYTSRSMGISFTLNSSYDDDGNATAYSLPIAPITDSVLSWNAENLMESVRVGSSITTYMYDTQARRIAKITGGITTLFVYDGFNCIAEYIQGVPAVLSKTRLWGQDVGGASGAFQSFGGVGGLLCEFQLSNSKSSIFYITYDGGGDVSEYLDSNSSIVAHLEYDLFGNISVNTGDFGLFTYYFSTKPLDAESGFYYYGHRYYDPLIGRWSSRDPIGEQGGYNLYSMLNNNIPNKIDYLGLEDCADGEIKSPSAMSACKSAANIRYQLYNISALSRANLCKNIIYPPLVAMCIITTNLAWAAEQSLNASLWQRCIDDAPCICEKIKIKLKR